MRGRSKIAVAAAVAAVVALAGLAGCAGASAGSSGAGSAGGAGSGSSGSPESAGAKSPSPISRTPADGLAGTLTVFAAASLKVTFDRLRTVFMAQHPAVDFRPITYDGSSTLATQIRGAAPADVFAAADEATMDEVAGLVTDRVDFATNTLQIAVAPGNPKKITSLAGLAAPGILTVICQAQVPCGAASQKALHAAGVTLTPASQEQNVTAVLTKVATGDADAGLVYRTDVAASGGTVEGVDFPQASEAVNTYPIAVLKSSGNAAAARAFVDLVTSVRGRQVLAAAGFGEP